MPNTRYTADEGDVASVADDLVRLWSENLRSVEGDPRAKLDWYYRRSPAGSGRAIVLRAHSDEGTSIIGCQGIGFRRVWCGDRELRAALLADLAVERRHRTLFPALTLARRTHDIAAESGEFQYGFPNHLAIELFKRLGYHVLGNMGRYARVLHLSPYFAQRFPVPVLSRGAGAVLDVVGMTLQVLPRVRAATRYRLSSLPGPDQRFDALFEEARGQYQVIAERGRDFLRWRFFVTRGGAELFTLLRRDDDALRAYAVVRQEGETVHISDFLAASESELEALFALLPPRLRARGCSSVSVRFLGDARIPRLLARCWFRKRDADRAVVLDCGEPVLAAALKDVQRFYLTDADEDN